MGRAQITRAMAALAGNTLESLESGSTDPKDAATAFLDSPSRQQQLMALARSNPLVLLPLLSPADMAAATPDDLGDRVANLVVRAKAVVEAISAQGAEASIDAAGLGQLEAIVRLTGRPSLLINDGGFDANLLPDGWTSLAIPSELKQVKAAIASVGRLYLNDASVERRFGIGTAWVCGPGLLMTNRHVVNELADPKGKGWKLRGVVEIDFLSEEKSLEERLFRVKSVALVLPKDGPDLAILKVDATGLPAPLTVASSLGEVKGNGDDQVYAIGYPGIDSGQNPTALAEYFKSLFGRKRIAPGLAMRVDAAAGTLDHDCTTLKGSSGSCIVRVGTANVVGLHFQGSAGVKNSAVLLAQTQKRLTDLGVTFAS
jgi:hypothetical protein